MLLITHEGISVAIGAAVGGITNAAAGATAVISSEKVEVREILSVLAMKRRESPWELQDRSVCTAFYGLQGMSSMAAEVQEIGSALPKQLK